MPVRDGFVVVDVDDFDAFDELDRRGMEPAGHPDGRHATR